MGNVTDEELKKMYEAAVSFKKAKPWTVIEEGQVVGVIGPEPQQIGYCSVTSEPERGLTLYLGEENWQMVKKSCSHEEGDENPLIVISETLQQNLLRCNLGGRTDLEEEEAERIARLGMRFRGEHAWPSCAAYLPGKEGKMIASQEDCSFLTCALKGMTLLADQIAKGQRQLMRLAEDGEILFLAADSREKSGFRYENKKVTDLKQYQPDYYIYTDQLSVQRVKKLPALSDAISCVQLLLPLPMKGNKDVFNPLVMVAMNVRRQEAVFSALAGDEEAEDYKARKAYLLSLWVKEMIENGAKPRSIIVETDDDYELFKDFCQKVEIKLKQDKLDDSVYDVVTEMGKSLLIADLGLSDEEAEDLFSFQEEDLDEYIDEVLGDFMKRGLKAGGSEDKRKIIVSNIKTFIRIMYEKLGEAPEEWTQEGIHILLSQIIPAEVASPKEDIELFPESVALFLEFLDEVNWKKVYGPAIAMIKKNSRVYIAKAEDEKQWGLIKKIAMKAAEEGINLGDTQKVEKYIEMHLGGGIAGRSKKAEKTDRNVSCPCGSGKKYKDCCGKFFKIFWDCKNLDRMHKINYFIWIKLVFKTSFIITIMEVPNC